MADDDFDPIARAFEEGTPIDEALALAAREARRWHKLMGFPIVEWRDEKVHWVAPEDIEIDES